MTVPTAGPLLIPAAVLVLAAAGLEAATETRQIVPAFASVALTGPVAAITFGWTRRMMRTQPRRAALGFIAGSLLRMLVAVTGGLLVATLTEWGRIAGVTFWIWLVVAYLSTLAAEVFVLAKPGWVGRGAVGRKG